MQVEKPTQLLTIKGFILQKFLKLQRPKDEGHNSCSIRIRQDAKFSNEGERGFGTDCCLLTSTTLLP